MNTMLPCKMFIIYKSEKKKERGKLTKWKMKIFSLEKGRKKKKLILAPHQVHEKMCHIVTI